MIHYPWTRLWAPREAALSFDPSGFPTDPLGDWGRAHYPNIVTLDELEGVRCLILLGEPGMGKTRALQEWWMIQEGEGNSNPPPFELGQFTTDGLLVARVFEHPLVQAWKEGGNGELTLVLDSLDEARLSIGTIHKLLMGELRRLPTARLKLRLTCRAADWPPTLEGELRHLWGDEQVKVYQLYPLREADVRTAAAQEGLDGSAFLREVARVGAVPLALKPLTLNFLLASYQVGQQLATSSVTLYEEGCLKLCEETPARREAGQVGTLEPAQRLTLARRAAALSVLGNKPLLARPTHLGLIPPTHLSLVDWRGSAEYASEAGILVTEGAVREVLDTGLFAAAGDGMRWAHWSYAEFLTATYLVEHQMAVPQILSLMTHPDDEQERIVPQLRETAAWVATMRPDVATALIARDPEVLLLRDVIIEDAALRLELAQALLEQYGSGRLDPDYQARRQFGRLAHPDLPALLRPYIIDSTQPPVAREMALEMAIACRVQTLQNDLAALALHESEPLPLREGAAEAVVEVGDSATKARLLPLAESLSGDDPYDTLKGYGLMALWPEHLSVAQILSLIRPSQRYLGGGAYQRFLSSRLVPGIAPRDLPYALAWAARHDPPDPTPIPNEIGEVIDELLAVAWEHLMAEGMIEAFAQVALGRLRRHKPMMGPSRGWVSPRTNAFFEQLHADATRRHHLFLTLLGLVAGEAKPSGYSLWGVSPLLLAKDIPWLVEQLDEARPDAEKRLLAEVISRVTNLDDPKQVEALYIASETRPILAEKAAYLFEPIRLDSEEATWRREAEQRQEGLQHPPLTPHLAAQVDQWLKRCEAGEVQRWEQLSDLMNPRPSLNDASHPDLTRFVVWQEAPQATREQILAAALAYVTSHEPEREALFVGGEFASYTLAGYRALRLLFLTNPVSVEALDEATWARWLPLILSYPFLEQQYTQTDRELRHLAYQCAPMPFRTTLRRVLDNPWDTSRFFVEELLAGLWDADLAAMVRDYVETATTLNGRWEDALDFLLRQGDEVGRRYAFSLVEQPPADEAARERRARAAFVLSHHAGSWEMLWAAMQQDEELSRSLLGRWAAERPRSEWLTASLTPQQVADLYLWTVRLYPHAEDPDMQGFHPVSTREEIGQYRDNLVRYLVGQGAHQAISPLVEALPHLPGLQRELLAAREVARQRWTPYPISTLLALAHNPKRRVVHTGTHLLDAVVESLDRLQTALQGTQPPAVEDLWSEWWLGRRERDDEEGTEQESGRGQLVWRPKYEASLANYVKRHLEAELGKQGIILNREVVIRNRERTDILVQAVPLSPTDSGRPLTIIIEVKGCWNKELWEGMERQLVAGYLRTEGTLRHGLYLVGWFNCQSWHEEKRKRDADRLAPTLPETRAKLEAQARNLSRDGVEVRAYLLDAHLPDSWRALP